jgi:hypothetical protein
MRAKLRERLTYSNVMATIAVFGVLAGGAYAASTLPKNSVTSRSVENNSLTGKDVKDGALTGKDVKDDGLTGADIKESTLGPVPAIEAAEPWHEVGAAGEPAFQNSYSNSGVGFETAAFYKDREGVVHLKGNVTGATATIFYLPAGDRPASGKELDFPVECNCTVTDSNSPTPDEVNVPTGRLQIFGDVGAPALNGAVNMTGISSAVSLNGVTFRAAG